MATFGYNKANEETYKQILAGYQAQANNFNADSSRINNGYQAMINDNMRVGESDRLALNQQFDRNSAIAQQSAVARGMGNTNVLDSMQRGNEYDRANATIGLNDSLYRRQTDLQNAQLGYQANAAQTQLGIGMQGMAYQGEALGQRYGAEAMYVTQADLAKQSAGYNQYAAQQQNQAQLQMQQNQFQQQERMANRYGYYS